MTTSALRAFLATSLDGFIAGPQDELDWLEEARPAHSPPTSGEWQERSADGLAYDDFLATIGCVLMGRRTYDVTATFPGGWPHGDLPVVVVTTRDLADAPATVTTASGAIEDLVGAARARAGGKDVYIDGGQMVRQALVAGVLDTLVVTVVPTILGAGIPLFAPPMPRIPLTVESVRKYGGGYVQTTYRCRGAEGAV